nr:gustatory receptor 34 [Papilio polytes]
MDILKSFKMLLVIGNLLFLFRNMSLVGLRIRMIMIFAIIVTISVAFYNCFVIVYYSLYFHVGDCINILMVFLNSLILILFSCYYSKRFDRLIICFNKHSSFFTKDELYLRRIKKRNVVMITFFILFVILKIILVFLGTKYYFLLRKRFSVFMSMCLRLNTVFNDVRYFYEYLLLYTLLGLISDQLDCVIRSIDRDVHISSTPDRIEVNTIRLSMIQTEYEKNIEQWSLIYSGIANTTDMFNNIFGVQITIMLMLAVTYITIFLYTITFLSVHGLYDTATLVVYIQKIIIMHIQILILSYTAQRIKNKVQTLRRRFGRLLLNSLNDYKRYRATKDLLRFISYRRLRIEAFGSIPVDMTLPPSCVMLFTSYTVIALQFNNVL